MATVTRHVSVSTAFSGEKITSPAPSEPAPVVDATPPTEVAESQPVEADEPPPLSSPEEESAPDLPPTQSQAEDAFWRAGLHLQNLIADLQVMLNYPEMAGELRRAAAGQQCQIPGMAKDWRLVKTVGIVLSKMPKPKVD